MVAEATMVLRVSRSKVSLLPYDFHFDKLCLTSIGKAWPQLYIKFVKSSLKNLYLRNVQRERLE